jgi:hypothetical protein
MKHIKVIIFSLMSVCASSAQTHTESIQDNQVLAKKITISGLLASEQQLLRTQKQLIEQIKKEEDNYQDKIGPLSNISSSIVYITVQTTMNDLQEKISNIEYNISVRKFATFGIRHGLSRIETELQRQKGYFLKLKEEHQVILTYALVSGGAGYNYTANLKLLLRIIKVRSKIFKIDRDVKNLMKISKLLAK